MAAPERLKLLVLLPARRRWPWHDRLATKLAADHDVTVAAVASPRYPWALRLGLRPTETRPQPRPTERSISSSTFPRRGAAEPQGRILRPHYDGSPDTRR